MLPGYADSGFGQEHPLPDSKFFQGKQIWDAPDRDCWITICAVCEERDKTGQRVIREWELGCINFERDEGEFKLTAPNTVGPLPDPGPKTIGATTYYKNWDKAIARWATPESQEKYFPTD